MKSKLNIRYKSKLWIFISFSLTCMISCVSDSPEENVDIEGKEIILGAYAALPTEVATRANTSITDIRSTYYDGVNFHIYVKGKDKEEEERKLFTNYVVPSGYNGAFVVADGERKANWFSRTGDHLIWSWTTPWDNDYKPASDYEPEESAEIIFHDTSITEATNSGASVFNADSWQNMKCLEQFVSAATGPVNYSDDGELVPLQFRHLVSKILLGSFSLVDNSTGSSYTTAIKGNITLYGLPRKARFYPARTETDSEGNVTVIPARVEKEEGFNYPQYEGVQFALTNYSRYIYKDDGNRITNPFLSYPSYYNFYDSWYICPEVDLSKLSFKIDIYEYVTTDGVGEWQLSRQHGENGAFYGDFSNIELTRTPGYNYDEGDDDFTTLHAGEYIVLSFNLSSKGNPSVKGTITDWNNTTMERGANKHDKSGLYTISEGQDFSSVMKSGDRDKIDEYFEIYGSGERTSDDPEDYYHDEDLGIFKLYEDIGYSGSGQNTTSGAYGKMPELCVADGYILDGMGHTVNCSTSSIKIGKVRNIYFRFCIASTVVATGETTYSISCIYIDNEGNVWKVNGDTYEMTPTGYNINSAHSNPFTISCSSGAVTG